MTERQQLQQHFIERFQRGEKTQAVSSTAIEHIASTLNVLLPASYRDFLETYGPVYTPDILDLIVLRNARLADIQQFQSIEDVIDSSQSLNAKGCLAFAADCSGNLFCFKSLANTLPAPDDAPVWLFDHETGKASKVATSFDAWLSQYTNLQPLRQDRTSKTSTTPPDHQYQIVLQFPDSFFADTPAILAFEEKLSSSMPRTQTYDGYDTGSGTTNFIIYSNTPNAVLANFRKYLGTNKVEKKVRIAYRSVDADVWTSLWPKRDTRTFDYRYD
jgi:hypothetical protein